MELKRYADAAPFQFGDFTVRELSPEVFSIGSVRAKPSVPGRATRFTSPPARSTASTTADTKTCDFC
jgi:hypothetical protein